MDSPSLDFKNRRMRLAELLLQVDEEKLIAIIESLLSSVGIPRQQSALTVEELDCRIAHAHEDIQAGRTMSSEELLTEIKNW
jgi:hypothetical protein